uniref:MSP domain-containing protein n=1 Tax=Parascaris univalens TaxID=6257 RepID=A0A915BRS3_PARUN
GKGSERMALNIDPPGGTFPASGGNATFSVLNLTEARMAFKIIRLEGPPKADKFVVQWAEVPDEETDAKAPFQAGAQAGEVVMPVKAE